MPSGHKKKKKMPSGLKKEKKMPSYESKAVKVNLNIRDSDVESDVALWDLYERWMTHYKLSRTPEENHKRFLTFKENVNYMQFQNKTDNFPYELELNKDSDMTTEEYEIRFNKHRGEFQHLDIHDSDVESDESLLGLYERWMIHYNESRSPDEKVRRFATFKEVVKYVHSENKRDHMSYKLGLNSFSDMSGEEFENKYNGGYVPEDTLKAYHRIRQMSDAPHLDYCGCMVEHEDELVIKLAVDKQLVHAIIDSRGDAFRNYRGGVLNEGYGKQLLLSVIIYGYGVTPVGVKYWTVETSWGEKWGDGGFMRMLRGNNFRAIASFASFPTTEKRIKLPRSLR